MAVSIEEITVVRTGEIEGSVRELLAAPASSRVHVTKAFWINRYGPFLVEDVAIGVRKTPGSRFVERHRAKLITAYVSGSE